MPDAAQGDSTQTLTARLRRLADAVALPPADADEGALLEIAVQALVPDGAAVVALLTRDAAGAVQLVAVAPAASAPAGTLWATVQREPDALGVYADRFAASETASSMPAASAPAEALAVVTEAPPAALFDAAGITVTTTVRVAGPGLTDALLLVGYGADSAPPSGEHLDVLKIMAALLGAALAVRAGHRREAFLRDQLEQSANAGRELAHQLNNDLTMPVGIIELLLDRLTVAPDLREMIQAASQDLAALERHIRAFHTAMRGLSGTAERAAGDTGDPSPRP